MLALLGRIIGLLPLWLSAVLGIVQAIIKGIKELITLVINSLFPLFPDNGKFEKFVLSVRNAINKFDDVFQKAKAFLIGLTGIKV